MIGYLEHFKEKPNYSQLLGWGNPWLVQIELRNSEWHVSLLSFSERYEETFIYMPLDPRQDPKFNTETWVSLFEPSIISSSSWRATVDLDTAKAILKHCDRLLNMVVFL